MSQKIYGIGVIGAGFGLRVHLPAFRAVTNARVIGLCSGRGTTVSSDLLEGIEAFSDPAHLIRDPRIDIVTVAVPPIAAASLIRLALESGKHVFAEKPLCFSASEARALLSFAKQSHRAHAVNFEFREMPVMRQMKQRLDLHEHGILHSVDITWSTGGWSNPHRLWGWQSDANAGGGVLTAMGAHVLDYLEWFFGPVRRVQAKTDIAIASRPDHHGILTRVTAPDHAVLVLELMSGIHCRVVLSNVADQPEGHWINIRGSDRSYRIGSSVLENFGTEYVLLAGDVAGDLELQDISDAVDYGTDGRIALTRMLAQRFLVSIDESGTSNFSPSFCEGLRVQVLLDAIGHAAATGVWVDIPSA